jgi:hypothetical protein
MDVPYDISNTDSAILISLGDTPLSSLLKLSCDQAIDLANGLIALVKDIEHVEDSI